MIIPPRDVITITIHNLENPPRVELGISRDLPFPIIIGFLSRVMVELSNQVWVQMTKPLSQFPQAVSPKAPLKAPTNNGAD